MTTIEKCPHCGSDVMLCKRDTMTFIPDFSLICLGCGMEFKQYAHPMSNVQTNTNAAKDLIEKFNKRYKPE